MLTGENKTQEIQMPPTEEQETENIAEQTEENAQQDNTQNEEIAQDPKEVKSTQEINFKALRESKERIEKERDEALARLAEYERQKEQITSPSQKESDDFGLGLSEDDLAEGRHLKKINAHIKKLEEQIKMYQSQSSEIAVETKLRQKYSDFEKVVNKENIAMLKELYPEIASTISSSNDLYNKAASAYTMIKKLGIVKEDNFKQDREIAQKNSSKPKPLASVSPQQGKSPLEHANAFANGLTEDLKKQLYREMIEASKRS